MSAPGRESQTAGLVYAFLAYLVWGFVPIYFKALKPVPPAEIVAHRVVWSVMLLAPIVLLAGRAVEVRAALRHLRLYVATTLLISANWLIYIWAVNDGQVLEASLGYFITPLVNVALGVVVLGERLTRPQKAAVALAGLGVANLVVGYGRLPMIALGLAFSFGGYGLLRKKYAIDPVVGLLVETSLMVPVAAAFLALRAAAAEAAPWDVYNGTVALLLPFAGVVTALPLIWFSHAARRLSLSSLGVMQYLSPTCQFLLAVLLYREPFRAAQAATFGCIWISLAIYTADIWIRGRARSTAS